MQVTTYFLVYNAQSSLLFLIKLVKLWIITLVAHEILLSVIDCSRYIISVGCDLLLNLVINLHFISISVLKHHSIILVFPMVLVKVLIFIIINILFFIHLVKLLILLVLLKLLFFPTIIAIYLLLFVLFVSWCSVWCFIDYIILLNTGAYSWCLNLITIFWSRYQIWTLWGLFVFLTVMDNLPKTLHELIFTWLIIIHWDGCIYIIGYGICGVHSHWGTLLICWHILSGILIIIDRQVKLLLLSWLYHFTRTSLIFKFRNVFI